MAYKLSHPNTSRRVEVNADQVVMFKSQGWETAPTAKDPEPAATKPTK